MEDPFGHRISYLRVSVTDRCNERCLYCMPQELQEWMPREEILSYEELLRVIRVACGLGVTKLRVTGGEPLARKNVLHFFRRLREVPGWKSLGISTNGTLLARDSGAGGSVAAALRAAGVTALNVSLDTLDRREYARIAGRDYLPEVLRGLDAARDAGFEAIRLNAVLVRGRTENEMADLVRFARDRKLLLRFIELMPVSTREVLDEDTFLPVAEAKRMVEKTFGPLRPRPDFRTNGPSRYFEVADTGQLLGFIGAMSDLHFCESCDKLRLTCDGKLRPCLGSWLEFDLREALRSGADDAALREIFANVVARKPKEHDFRNLYQPNRKMVAIGG